MSNSNGYSPTFGWWLFAIIIASGFGTVISTLLYEKLSEASQEEAQLQIVDADVQRLAHNNFRARIMVSNTGDRPGIITSVRINGSKYEIFSTSRVAGLAKGRQKQQYEAAPSAISPPHDYTEVAVSYQSPITIQSVSIETGTHEIFFKQ